MTERWRKLRKFIIHKVLHADDTPHRVALGVAIGIFVGLTPTVGFQMVIALAVATAFRANKVVCLPMVWITNPFTMFFIYPLCHRLGSGLIGSAQDEQTAVGTMFALVEELKVGGLARFFELGFWNEVFLGLTRVGAELWVGCLLAGFIAAVISYFASRWTVSVYRERRRALFESRLARRSARRAAQGFGKRIPARGPLA